METSTSDQNDESVEYLQLQRKSTTLREKRAMMSRTITSNMEFLQVKDIINNEITRQPRKSITFKMTGGTEGSSKTAKVRPSIFKKGSIGGDSLDTNTIQGRKNITWKAESRASQQSQSNITSSRSADSSGREIVLRKPRIIQEEQETLCPKQLKKKIQGQLDQIIEGYQRANPLLKQPKEKASSRSLQKSTARTKERPIVPESHSQNRIEYLRTIASKSQKTISSPQQPRVKPKFVLSLKSRNQAATTAQFSTLNTKSGASLRAKTPLQSHQPRTATTQLFSSSSSSRFKNRLSLKQFIQMNQGAEGIRPGSSQQSRSGSPGFHRLEEINKYMDSVIKLKDLLRASKNKVLNKGYGSPSHKMSRSPKKRSFSPEQSPKGKFQAHYGSSQAPDMNVQISQKVITAPQPGAGTGFVDSLDKSNTQGFTEISMQGSGQSQPELNIFDNQQLNESLERDFKMHEYDHTFTRCIVNRFGDPILQPTSSQNSFIVQGASMPIHPDFENVPAALAEENTRKIHHGHIVVKKPQVGGHFKYESINEDIIPDLNAQTMSAGERKLLNNMTLLQKQRDKRDKENRMEGLKAEIFKMQSDTKFSLLNHSKITQMASLLNNQEELQEQQRAKDEIERQKTLALASPSTTKKKKPFSGLNTPTTLKENTEGKIMSRSASKQPSRASRSNSPHRSVRAKKFEFESTNSKRLITVQDSSEDEGEYTQNTKKSSFFGKRHGGVKPPTVSKSKNPYINLNASSDASSIIENPERRAETGFLMSPPENKSSSSSSGSTTKKQKPKGSARNRGGLMLSKKVKNRKMSIDMTSALKSQVKPAGSIKRGPNSDEKQKQSSVRSFKMNVKKVVNVRRKSGLFDTSFFFSNHREHVEAKLRASQTIDHQNTQGLKKILTPAEQVLENKRAEEVKKERPIFKRSRHSPTSEANFKELKRFIHMYSQKLYLLPTSKNSQAKAKMEEEEIESRDKLLEFDFQVFKQIAQVQSDQEGPSGQGGAVLSRVKQMEQQNEVIHERLKKLRTRRITNTKRKPLYYERR